MSAHGAGGAEKTGLDLSYEFIPYFYELAQSRMRAVEEKLEKMLVASSSIAIGVPTLAKGVGLATEFSGPSFSLAMITAAFILVIGLITRHRGTIWILEPQGLIEKRVDEEGSVVKWQLLYWAGEHFKRNYEAIQTKAAWLDGLTYALALQVALLAIWILTY